jgi:hypothetical protein
MSGEFSFDEVELLNAYFILGPSGKKEMSDYLRYLLIKQYKKELVVSIFNNQLLNSLLHRILHIVEREDFEIDQMEKRVLQFKEIYFGTFEQVHCKYAELIPDLDSYEIIKDFGKNSIENIMQSCSSGNRSLIRFEIIELGENFNKLARKKDARKIVAV